MQHETRDTRGPREQVTQFEGVLLGHASSQRHASTRWHEIRVFRTDGGMYVIEKIGRTTLPGEVDRYTTAVSETPEGAIESLYTRDDAGVLHLTYVARDALEQACDADEDVAQAYGVRTLA